MPKLGHFMHKSKYRQFSKINSVINKMCFNCIHLIKPTVSLPGFFLVEQSLQTLNTNGIIGMQSMPALCWDPSIHAVSEYKAQRSMHTLRTNSLYNTNTQFVSKDVGASLSLEI